MTEKELSVASEFLNTFVPLDARNKDVNDNTPNRLVKAYQEILSGYSENPKDVFRNRMFKEEASGTVCVKNIQFFSLCEHHMLPFFGHVDIAFVPKSGNIPGLSCMARLVKVLSRRIQLQERFTREIGETIVSMVNPSALFVRVRGQHLCMLMRGSQAIGSYTETTYSDHNYREAEDQVIAQLRELLLTP